MNKIGGLELLNLRDTYIGHAQHAQRTGNNTAARVSAQRALAYDAEIARRANAGDARLAGLAWDLAA